MLDDSERSLWNGEVDAVALGRCNSCVALFFGSVQRLERLVGTESNRTLIQVDKVHCLRVRH